MPRVMLSLSFAEFCFFDIIGSAEGVIAEGGGVRCRRGAED